jgi:hypothetical protein
VAAVRRAEGERGVGVVGAGRAGAVGAAGGEGERKFPNRKTLKLGRQD